jgi:hypothetical protein
MVRPRRPRIRARRGATVRRVPSIGTTTCPRMVPNRRVATATGTRAPAPSSRASPASSDVVVAVAPASSYARSNARGDVSSRALWVSIPYMAR